MKALVALAAACLAISCTSGRGGATILRPELDLVQLKGQEELNYQQGQIEIQFGLRIANRSSEPITLRQIQLEPVSSGGPYRLRRETYHFRQVVGPGQFTDVPFWAKAVSTGDFASIDATAPITVRCTALFESPSGSFRQVFVKMLTQIGGSGPR